MKRGCIWANVLGIAGRSMPRCCCACTLIRRNSLIGGFRKEKASVERFGGAGPTGLETTACVNCHAISGTVAGGRFGPDLTHLMGRDHDSFRGRSEPPEQLKLWIRNPDAIKPGSVDACNAAERKRSGRAHRVRRDAPMRRAMRKRIAMASETIAITGTAGVSGQSREVARLDRHRRSKKLGILSRLLAFLSGDWRF